MDAAPQNFEHLSHSSLCSLGWMPTLIEGGLRLHLASHFSGQRLIEQPNLRDYLWTAQFDTSQISIESVGRWRPDNAGARPAIVLRRNSYQPQKISIGNKIHGLGDGAARAYAEFAIGSHTLLSLIHI